MSEQEMIRGKIMGKNNEPLKIANSLEMLLPESIESAPSDAASSDTASPDPLQYAAGEIIKQVKGIMVPTPDDSTYQFARKIAEACMDNSKGPLKGLLSEGLSLGVYKMLEQVMSYVTKKRI